MILAGIGWNESVLESQVRFKSNTVCRAEEGETVAIMQPSNNDTLRKVHLQADLTFFKRPEGINLKGKG